MTPRAPWKEVCAAVAVVVIGLFVVRMMERAHDRITIPVPSSYRARHALARQIQTKLPHDAVIGSWNAGVIGFFSERPVVNLDGLVNDKNYFEFLRDGGDLRQYLIDEGIQYIADYNSQDLLVPRSWQWQPDESFRGLWSLSDLDVLIQEEWGTEETVQGRILVFKIPSPHGLD